MYVTDEVLIGGDWVPAKGTYEIIDPATEETIGRAPDCSEEQMRDACRAAKSAFEEGPWPRMSGIERGKCLARAADRLEARTDDLVELAIAETGSTVRHSEQVQVRVAVDRLRMYAELARESTETPMLPFERERIAGSSASLASGITTHEPVGVVACICPSNTPVTNCAGKIGPALAMGNSVILKPPVQDPLGMAELAREVARELPPGVLNYVAGKEPELGETLVAAPEVDMISFTGSTRVGVRIAEVAGRSMKRTLLELGGKSADIVFADANLENALIGAASTWTFHSGQMCIAPTRLLVERAFHDEFVEAMVGFARGLKIGDTRDPQTDVGPLISAAQRAHVERYVAAGLEEGVSIACGGVRPPELKRGFFYEPTLLAEATNEMSVAREELFGPVITVIPFDSEEEAVAMANDSELGLYGYVWSGDTHRAVRIARQLRVGTVQINGAPPNPDAPFGGFKMSGIGRDGGRYGLAAYSELKYVGWGC